MVSPKRGEAAEAGAAVAAAEIALAEARATSSRPGSTGGAPVADVFRLAKAMPASADQSSLVLELSKLAEAERRHAPRDRAAGASEQLWAGRLASRSP